MDRKKIKSTLTKFIKKTVKTVHPNSIILYGSFARGTATSWSDIDIAVIAPTKSMSEIEHIADSIKSEFMFDIRNYSRKEFENISPLSIYSEIKREGITIYEKR